MSYVYVNREFWEPRSPLSGLRKTVPEGTYLAGPCGLSESFEASTTNDRFRASQFTMKSTAMGALQSAPQLRERLHRRAGTIETPGALRARGVDITILTCDQARTPAPAKRNTTQIAPKLEGETCYNGADSRGRAWRPWGGVRLHVPRLRLARVRLGIFCSLQSATITSTRH
jgi:hypothetical protein